MARFDGRVAIVTGASGGLGPIMAKMLADEGANVVLAARRQDMVEAEAAKIGPAAIAVCADVTEEADVAAMVDAAMMRWGKVDILVNNAAVTGKDKFIWEQTLDNWNATFAVDVTAPMLCSREVLRRSMIERRSGAIVSISSTAGFVPLARKSHYCTAKAALRALTKSIAQEAGQYGVRCNCVAPGQIETDLLKRWFERSAAEEGVTPEQKRLASLSGMALKTVTRPEEVAHLVLFLASDEARTITGQTMVIDAGNVMMG